MRGSSVGLLLISFCFSKVDEPSLLFLLSAGEAKIRLPLTPLQSAAWDTADISSGLHIDAVVVGTARLLACMVVDCSVPRRYSCRCSK